MWGRLTTLVGGGHGNDQLAGEGVSSSYDTAASTVLDINDPTDSQIQLIEHERLVIQLKEMIRDRENALVVKETELKKVNAEFSKHKLQTKAKLASFNQQLEQAQRAAADAVDKASVGSDESVSTLASEFSSTVSEQTSRARLSLLKKKLRDRDAKLVEKDAELQQRFRELEVKDKILVERDAVVKSLSDQLALFKSSSGSYDQSNPEEKDVKIDVESHLQQMYSQMVYKDSRLLELNELMDHQDMSVIDMQELVGEKEEVIRSRDKAIRILQSSISDKEILLSNQQSYIAQLTSQMENMRLELMMFRGHSSLQTDADQSYVPQADFQQSGVPPIACEDDLNRLKMICVEKNYVISTLQDEIRRLSWYVESDGKRMTEVPVGMPVVPSNDVVQVEINENVPPKESRVSEELNTVSFERLAYIENLEKMLKNQESELAQYCSQIGEQQATIQDLHRLLAERDSSMIEFRNIVESKDVAISRLDAEYKIAISDGQVKEAEMKKILTDLDRLMQQKSEENQALLLDVSNKNGIVMGYKKAAESCFQKVKIMLKTGDSLDYSLKDDDSLGSLEKAFDLIEEHVKALEKQLLNRVEEAITFQLKIDEMKNEILYKEQAGTVQTAEDLKTEIETLQTTLEGHSTTNELLTSASEIQDTTCNGCEGSLSKNICLATESLNSDEAIVKDLISQNEKLTRELTGEEKTCSTDVTLRNTDFLRQVEEQVKKTEVLQKFCRTKYERARTVVSDQLHLAQSSAVLGMKEQEVEPLRINACDLSNKLERSGEMCDCLQQTLMDEDAIRLKSIELLVDAVDHSEVVENLLKNQISHMEKQLEHMLNEKMLLIEEIEKQKETIAVKESKIDNLVSEILQKDGKPNDNVKEISQIQKRLSEINDLLGVKDRKIEEQQQIIRDYETQLASQNESLSSCQNKIDDLLVVKTELLKQVDNLEEANRTCANTVRELGDLQKVIDDFNKDLITKEVKIAELSNMAENCNDALSKKTTDLESSEKQCRSLSGKCKQLAAKVKQLMESISEKDKRLDHLEQSLRNAENTFDMKHAELETIQRVFSAEKEDLLAKIDTLEKDISTLRGENVGLCSITVNSQDLLTQMNSELDKERALIADLRNVFKVISRLCTASIEDFLPALELAELRVHELTCESLEVKELLDSVKALVASNVEINTKLNQLNSQVQESESNQVALRDQVLDLRNQVDKIKVDVTDKEEKVECLLKDVSDLGSSLELHQKENERLQQLLKDSESFSENAAKERNELEVSLTNARKNEEALGLHIVELETSVRNLEVDRQSFVKRNEDLDEEIKVKDSKLQQLVFAFSENDGNIGGYLKEIETLQALLTDTNSSIAFKDKEIDEHKRYSQECLSKLNNFQDQLSDCQRQIEEYDALKTERESEIAALRDELKITKDSLDKMSDELVVNRNEVAMLKEEVVNKENSTHQLDHDLSIISAELLQSSHRCEELSTCLINERNIVEQTLTEVRNLTEALDLGDSQVIVEHSSSCGNESSLTQLKEVAVSNARSLLMRNDELQRCRIEIDKLSSLITSKDELAQEFSNRVLKLEQTLNNKVREFDNSEKKCNNLTGKCKQLATKVKQLMESITEKDKRLDHLEQSLRNAEITFDMKHVELETIQCVFSTEKDDLLAKIDTLEKDISTLRGENVVLCSNTVNSQDLLTQMNSELDKERALIADLRNLFKVISSLCTASNEDFLPAFELAELRVHELTCESLEVKESLDSVKALVASNVEINTKLNQLYSQVQESESNKVALLDQVLNLHNQFDKVKVDVTDKEEKVECLLKDVSELGSSLEFHQKENERLQQLLKDSESFSENAAKERNELEVSLTNARKNEEALGLHIVELETSVRNLEVDRQSFVKRNEDLDEEIKVKDSKLQQLVFAFSENDANVGGYLKEIETLQALLTDTNSSIAFKDKEIDEHKRYSEECLSKLNNFQDQLSDCQRQIEEYDALKTERKSEIAALRDELKITKDGLDKISDELVVNRNEVAMLKEEVANKENSTHQLDHDLSIISAELLQSSHRCEELSTCLINERNIVEQTLTEVRNLTEALDLGDSQVIVEHSSSCGNESSLTQLKEVAVSNARSLLMRNDELHRYRIEIDKLSSLITSKDELAQEFSNRVLELEQSLNNKVREFDKSEKKCNNLTGKCKQLATKVKQLMESISEKDKHLGRLEQRLQNSESTFEMKQAELETIQREFFTGKEDFLAKTNAMEKDISTLRDENAVLSSNTVNSQDLLTQINAELDKERALIADLRNLFKVISSLCTASNEDFLPALELAELRVHELTCESLEVKESLDSVKALVASNVEINTKLNQLNSQVQESESNKVALLDQVLNLHNQLDKVKVDVTDKEENVVCLLKDVSELGSSLELHQKENERLQQLLKDSESFSENAAKERNELEVSLTNARKNEETLGLHIVELETSVRNLEVDRQSFVKRNEDLDEEIKVKDSKLQQLAFAFSENDGNVGGYLKEIETLQALLTDTNSSIASKDKEIDEHKRYSEECLSKLNNFQDQLSDCQRRLEEYDALKTERESEIGALRDELKITKDGLDKMSDELVVNRNEVAMLKEEVANKENSTHQLDHDLSIISAELLQSSHRCEELTTCLTNDGNFVEQTLTEVRNLTEALDLGDSQVIVEHSSSCGNESSLTQLKEVAVSNARSLLMRNDELQRCRIEKDKLSSLITSKDELAQEFSNRVLELEQTLNNKVREFDNSAKKCNNLTGKCKQLATKVKQLMESITEKDKRLDHLEQSLRNAEITFDMKHVELETIQRVFSAEKEDLLAKIDTLEKDISTLRGENVVLCSNTVNSQDLLTQMNSELDKERALIADLRNVFKVISRLCTASIEDFLPALELAELRVHELTCESLEVKELLDSVKALVASNVEINTKLNQLNSQVHESESNKVALRDQVLNLQNQVDKFKVDVTDKEEKVECLLKDVSDLGSSLELHKKENERLLQLLKDSESFSENAAKERNELEVSLTNVRKNEEALGLHIVELETSVRSLEVDRQSFVKRNEDLDEEIKVKDSKLEQLAFALSEKDGNVGGNLKELETLQALLTDTTSSIAFKDKEIDEHKRYSEECLSKLNNFQDQLSDCQRRLEEYDALKTEREIEIGALRDELKITKDGLDKISDELVVNRNEVAMLKEEVANKENSTHQLDHDLSVISAELLQNSHRCEELSTCLTNERCTVEQILTEVRNLTEALDLGDSQVIVEHSSSCGNESSLTQLKEVAVSNARSLLMRNDELQRCRIEIDKLSSLITSKDELAQEFSNRVLELEQSLNNKVREFDKSEKKCNNLTGKCKQLATKVKQLMESISEKDKHLGRLEQRLQNSESTFEMKQAELETIQREFFTGKEDFLAKTNAMEKDISTLRDENAVLSSNTVNSQDLLTQINAELDKERALIADLRNLFKVISSLCTASNEDFLPALELAELRVHELTCESLEVKESLDSVKALVASNVEINTKLNQLYSQVQESESNKVALLDQVLNLHNQLDKVKVDVTDKEENVVCLLKDVSELGSSLELHQKENERLQQLLKDSESFSENAAKERNELEVSLTNARKNEETLGLHIVELETSVRNLEVDRQSFVKRNEDLDEEIKVKDSKLQQLAFAFSENDGNVGGYLKEIETLQALLTDTNSSIASKDKEIDEHKRYSEECLSKLNNFQDQLSDCQRRIEEYDALKTERESEIAALRDELKITKDGLDKMSDELVVNRNEVAMLKEEVANKENSTHQLDHDLSIISAELLQSSHRCEELSTCLINERNIVEQTLTEVRNLTEALDLGDSQVIVEHSSSCGNESSLTQLKEVAVSNARSLLMRNDELQRYRIEIDKLSSLITSKDELAQEFSNRVLELEQTLNNKVREFDNSEKKCNNLTGKCKQLATKVKQLMESITEKDKHLDHLEQSLRNAESIFEVKQAVLETLQREFSVEKEDFLAKTDALEKDISTLRGENVVLCSNTVNSQDLLTQMNSELDKERAFIADLRNVFKVTSRLCTASIEDFLPALELAELRVHELTCESLEVKELLDSVKALVASNVEINTKLNQVNSQVYESESDKATLSVRVFDLQSNLDILKLDVIDKEEKVQCLLKEVSELSSSLDHHQKENEQLQQLLQDSKSFVSCYVTTDNWSDCNRESDSDFKVQISSTVLGDSKVFESENLTSSSEVFSYAEKERSEVLFEQREFAAVYEEPEQAVSVFTSHEQPKPDTLTCSYCCRPLDTNMVAVHGIELRLRQYENDVVHCSRQKVPNVNHPLMNGLESLSNELRQIELQTESFCFKLRGNDVRNQIESKISIRNEPVTEVVDANVHIELQVEASSVCEQNTQCNATVADGEQGMDPCLSAIADIIKRARSVRSVFDTVQHLYEDSLVELTNLRDRITAANKTIEERTCELNSAKTILESSETKFEKLRVRSIGKVKELTANHKIMADQKQREIDELKTKFSDQSIITEQLGSEMGRLRSDLEKSQKSCADNKRKVEELLMLIDNKNCQIMALTEGSKTTDISAHNLTGDGNFDKTRIATFDTGCQSECDFVDANHYNKLEKCLNDTKIIFLSILDSDNDKRNVSAENLNEFLALARNCRQLVSSLRSECLNKEAELLSAKQCINDKETLAKRYAATAKKLKQQLEEVRDASAKQLEEERSNIVKNVEELLCNLCDLRTFIVQKCIEQKIELSDEELNTHEFNISGNLLETSQDVSCLLKQLIDTVITRLTETDLRYSELCKDFETHQDETIRSFEKREKEFTLAEAVWKHDLEIFKSEMLLQEENYIQKLNELELNSGFKQKIEELALLNDQLLERDTIVANYEISIVEKEKELSSSRETVELLDRQLESTKKELDALRLALTEKDSELMQLSGNHKGTDNQTNKLKLVIKKLKSRLDEMELNKIVTADEMNRLKEHASVLSSQLSDTHSLLKETESRLLTAEFNFNELTNRLQDEKPSQIDNSVQMEEITKNLQQLQHDYESLKYKLGSQEELLGECDLKIVQLSQLNEVLTSRLSEVTGRFDEVSQVDLGGQRSGCEIQGVSIVAEGVASDELEKTSQTLATSAANEQLVSDSTVENIDQRSGWGNSELSYITLDTAFGLDNLGNQLKTILLDEKDPMLELSQAASLPLEKNNNDLLSENARLNCQLADLEMEVHSLKQELSKLRSLDREFNDKAVHSNEEELLPVVIESSKNVDSNFQEGSAKSCLEQSEMTNCQKFFNERTDVTPEIEILQRTSDGDSEVGQNLLDLQQRCASLELELSSVLNELSREKEKSSHLALVEEHRNNLAEENRSFREQIDALSLSKEKTIEKMKKMKDKKDQMTLHSNSVQRELQQALNALAKLESDKEQYGREFEIQNEHRLSDLQHLHSALLVDNQSLQDMVQQLTSEKNRLEHVVKESSISIERLKTKNTDLHQVKQEMENRLQHLEENIANDADSSNNKVNSESERIATLHLELESAQRNSASLQDEIDGLNWKVQELSEIEEEMQQLQGELFQAKSENGMLKKKVSALEKEKENHKCRQSEIDESGKHETNLLEEKESMLNLNQARTFVLEKHNDDLLCENTLLKNRLADMEVDLYSLKEELSKQTLYPKDSNLCIAGPDEIGFAKLTSVSDSLESDGFSSKESSDKNCPKPSEMITCQELFIQRTDVKPDVEVMQRAFDGDTEIQQNLLDLQQRCAYLELELSSISKELSREKEKSSHLALVGELRDNLVEENRSYREQIDVLSLTKEKMIEKMKILKDSNDKKTLHSNSVQRELEQTLKALAQFEADKERYRKEFELQKERSLAFEINVTELTLELDRKHQDSAKFEKDYQVAITALQEKAENLELEVTQLHDVIDTKGVEVDRLLTEKQNMDFMLAACQAEMASRVSLYENHLEDNAVEKGNHVKAFEGLQLEFAVFQETSSRRLSDLQHLHSALLVDNESLQDMVQHLTSEKNRLEHVVKESSISIERLKTESQLLSIENTDLHQVKQEMENRLQHLEENIANGADSSNNKVNSESERIATLQLELESAQRNSASLQDEIDGLNWKVQELSEIEEEMQQLQEELFQAQSENGMLKNKVGAIEKEFDNYRFQQMNKADEFTELQKQAEFDSEMHRMRSEIERLSSELASLREIHESCPVSTGGIDVGMQCCFDEPSDSQDRFREELSRIKTENARPLSSVSVLQSGVESLQEKLSAESSGVVRPSMVNQFVQTSDGQSSRRMFTSMRKKETSHLATKAFSSADRSLTDETWASVPLSDFEYTPIHLSSSFSSSTPREGIVRDVQLEQDLLREQRKRFELEETVDLLLKQQKQQEQQDSQQLIAEEFNTASRSELAISVESDDEESGDLAILIPRTTLSRQFVCWLRRIKHRLCIDGISVSHMIRARVRIRAIFVLYIIALHFYVLFGCLLT